MTDNTRRIGTLEDLQPALLNVEVELEDGQVVVFPMKMPTFFEMLRLERDMPLPEPEINGVDPITKRPMRDTSDPAYIRRANDVQTRRNIVQLVRSLQMDIPGDSEREKADWLQESIAPGIMRQLVKVIQQVFLAGEARIEDRAATFQTDGHLNSADNGTDAPLA